MREKRSHLYVDGEERKLLLHSLVGLKNQLIFCPESRDGSWRDEDGKHEVRHGQCLQSLFRRAACGASP